MVTQPYIIILESLATLGIVVGGIGFFISSFKKGNREFLSSSAEMVEFYKTENANLKSIMADKDKSNDEKFQQLNKELGEIRGQLIEKDKQNKQYLDILQNRDPDTQKFQELLVKSASDQNEINKQVVEILQEIQKYAILEHERDFLVTSTISKQ